VNEKPAKPAVSDADVAALREATYKPLAHFEKHKGVTTQRDVNPNYIRPKMFMTRLQKLMDEYAGGVTSQFTTSKPLLDKGLDLLTFLKEDADKLGAEDLHELMRCWENYHRMFQAEAHVRTVLFREETRWPGYYFRSDFPKIDENGWRCFVNCRYDATAGTWELSKKPIVPVFKPAGA
jgi:adenylylsulfate reductase subunit A